MKTNICKTPLPGLLLALVVGWAGLHEVSAAKAQFERTKPHVNVAAIGSFGQTGSGLGFDLLLEMRIAPDGTARGGMNFVFADGSVRLLAAAGAMIQANDGESTRVIVFFTPITAHGPSSRKGELYPAEGLVAVLQSNSDGTIDIDIPGIFNLGSTQLEFAVSGSFSIDDD